MALKCAPPTLRPVNAVAARVPPKTADAIYKTPEFLMWRKIVIERAGRRCEWPGCGRAERRMFADHIIEIKDGGAKFDLANGQCLCGSHHTLKTATERRQRMARASRGEGG